LSRKFKIPTLILTMVVLTAVLFSCGGTKTTTLSPSEIIDQSGTRLQALNSYHFLLEQAGGGTPIGMGVEMKKAEGDILRPDKLQATLSGAFAGMTLEVKIVSVGGSMKMTNPLTGKWEVPSASFNVLSVFDPNKGIAAILKSLTEVSKLDDVQSGGVPCYHLSGNIKSENLAAITGSAAPGSSITTEVSIGKDDLLVREVRLTGQITETEVKGIVRTLSFSNFNQSITIEMPQ
jgi:hypothetical protein